MSITNYISTTLRTLLAALLLVLPSCVYDEAPQPSSRPSDDTETMMSLTISVPGTAGSTSRGTAPEDGGEQIEPGNELENKIDVENRDFRIYFYGANNDNTYLGQMQVRYAYKTGEGENHEHLGDTHYHNNEYTVGGIAPDAVVNAGAFRVVIIANLSKWYRRNMNSNNQIYGGYHTDENGNLTDTTIDNGFTTSGNLLGGTNGDHYYYGYRNENNLNNNNEGYTTYGDNGGRTNGFNVNNDPDGKLIPMWGIHQYEGIEFKPGIATVLPYPIDMMRTMAKIEVVLSNELAESGVKLGDVSLKDFYNQATLPQGGIQNNRTTPDFDQLNMRQGRTHNTIYFSEETKDEGIKKKVVYVPELKLQMKDDYIPTIKIKLGEKEYSLILKDLDILKNITDENKQGLLRNHIYRLTIKEVSGNLGLYYDFAEYTQSDNKIEFGNTENVDHNN